MKGSIAIAIGLCVLMCCCVVASAGKVTDGNGDVYHWSQTGSAWSWRANIADKPDIDITEISYSVDDDKLTLTLKVKGSIQSSEKIAYWVYYNSTDTAYWLMYSNGSGFGMGTNQVNMDMRFTENISISGGTLSAVLDVIGDTSTVALWGWAAEYTDYQNQAASEWWGDWAPNNKFIGGAIDDGSDDGTGDEGPGDDGDNGDTSKPSTPGFELLSILVALGIAFILLRRRK